MKYVLDFSIAIEWYMLGPQFSKASKLRHDFLTKVHEPLVHDVFPSDCAEGLVIAERKGHLPLGHTALHLADLELLGISLHPSFPLLKRAAAISLSTRLTVRESLYVALAEREQCELLTTNAKLLRKTRKPFPFVIDLDSLP